MRTFYLSMIAASALSAQDFEQPKTYLVHLSCTDSITEAHVFYQNPRIKVAQGKYYHWYRDDKILFSEGGFDGKLLHGEYACFFSDRKLKEKGEFREGQRNGKWVKWYSNGVIRETCQYSGGKRNGKYFLYSSGGQKVMQATYRYGLLHGIVIHYENGVEKSRKKYNEGVEVLPKKKKEKRPKRVRLKEVK